MNTPESTTHSHSYCCNLCDKKSTMTYRYNSENYCRDCYETHKHYDGKHTKSCPIYSSLWAATVCRRMLRGGKPHFFQSDEERLKCKQEGKNITEIRSMIVAEIKRIKDDK